MREREEKGFFKIISDQNASVLYIHHERDTTRIAHTDRFAVILVEVVEAFTVLLELLLRETLEIAGENLESDKVSIRRIEYDSQTTL